MKELVVISGKGGTGKTSLVASFAALAGGVVTADCDVDASDLHLLLDPETVRKQSFSGGKAASVVPEKCNGCGKCEELCRYGAVVPGTDGSRRGKAIYTIDKIACEGCGVCAYFCPTGAIEFDEEVNGEWFVSETRFGPMTHARLYPGSENSGKLVTVVRTEAKRIAGERGISLVMIDGSPGIGCPVIASVAGADRALVVTEPTMSGLHDLERITELTGHFGIETAITVNKQDINEDMSQAIEDFAVRKEMAFLGGIRYDEAVTRAQIEGRTVVEFSNGPASADIRRVWEGVVRFLDGIES
jgi:MinD superfamily P-loop ATPase